MSPPMPRYRAPAPPVRSFEVITDDAAFQDKSGESHWRKVGRFGAVGPLRIFDKGALLDEVFQSRPFHHPEPLAIARRLQHVDQDIGAALRDRAAVLREIVVRLCLPGQVGEIIDRDVDGDGGSRKLLDLGRGLGRRTPYAQVALEAAVLSGTRQAPKQPRVYKHFCNQTYSPTRQLSQTRDCHDPLAQGQG